jgi:hypothetical protein
MRKISDSGERNHSRRSSSLSGSSSSSRLQFLGSLDDIMELSDDSYELEEGEIREDVMAVDMQQPHHQHSPRLAGSPDSRDRSKPRRRNERDRDLRLNDVDFDRDFPQYEFPNPVISDDMDQDVAMTDAVDPPERPSESLGGFSAFPALFTPPVSSSATSSRSGSTSSTLRSSISIAGDHPSDHDPSYNQGYDGNPSAWIKIDLNKPVLVLDVASTIPTRFSYFAHICLAHSFISADVAFSFDNRNFLCEAIQKAGEYFQSKGYRVRGIIRDTFLRPRHAKGSLVDRPEYLRYLRDFGLLEITEVHDDPVAIRYAYDKNGFIVSNDKYRDQRTYGDPKLAAYLKFARISVEWKFGEFTPVWGDNAFLPGERG